MRVLFLLALVQLTSALEIQKPDGDNFAYVTMWVNKPTVPAHVFKHVLSKAERDLLNSGEVNADSGKINLDKHQKVKTSISFAEQDKPKKEAELKVKIPLRPRNSQFRGITDLATNLREVGSKYPLVVMTNSEDLQDPELLKEHPNIKLVLLNETDFIERHCKIGVGHELHFQKLMIWKLTQYDKLIWVDTDVSFVNNADYVFNMDVKGGNRIYGQIDDYHCDGRDWSPTSGGICSGMLLLKPSTLHYQGLMMQQQRMQACWGDQSIISSYFAGGKGKQAMQFQRKVINFARCTKMGQMDVVHFSGDPSAKRIGDGEDMKRTSTGALVNKTALKLKAQKKAEEKKAAQEAAKEAKKAKKEAEKAKTA